MTRKPVHSFSFAVYGAIFLVCLVTFWTLLLVFKVEGHEAIPTAAKPQGWNYPFSCCSGIDCREVSDQAISERPEGYVIKGTGEVIAYSDIRIKDSPDGVFHWCSVAGADDSRTICLFVPPRGF